MAVTQPNIFLALLDSASIAHDVANLEALKAAAETDAVQAPTSSNGEWRHAIPYGAQTAPAPPAQAPSAQAPPAPEATAVGAGWLLERCRALGSEMGGAELACGVIEAAQKDDASMQQALMELLGFGDAALALMGELCAQKRSVAAVDARDVRAIARAAGAAPPAAPPRGPRQRGGAVTVQAPKKQSQRQMKQLRRQRREIEAKGPDEGAAYLAALGFEDPDVPEAAPKHAAFLEEAQREYRGARAGLPSGAEKFYGDGYEEVEIPPPKALAPARPGDLLRISEALPAWARRCFRGTDTLNRIQSAVYPCAFESRKNMLVCAPTGAGKTNVALMTILELCARVRSQNEGDFLQALAAHKAVYVAPLKALAQEIVAKFSEKLGYLGLVVRELTGDVQLSKREADAAHILVVTPEKWDVVTRKQGGGSGDAAGSLASRCRLLIIDEIHLLAEERGAVLECVVARTTRLVESTQEQIRLVGLSATLPNYEDVGQFLGCPDEAVFFFGPEFRPVPLKQTFVGVTATKRHEKKMRIDELAYDVAMSAVDRGHQVMVFVHSRKGTLKTARDLRDRAARNNATFASQEGDLLKPFRSQLKTCRHKELAEVVESGFSLHHAGMSRSDRGLSERLFAAGAVRVLCCTATLAWGVNLPAHAVICKGTDVYDPQRGGNVDLSMLDVLQIFGRAGRPQFDDFGEATLLTSSKALPDYLRKLARAAPIESCLVPRLADAINAEVAAGTVASISDANRWLDHTFLAVRLKRNPLAYGCAYDQAQEDPGMGRYRDTLLRAAARKLDEARMCRYDKRSGAVAGTDFGRVGSHYYLRHESIREFNETLRQHANDADILVVVCGAYEFEQLKPRNDEMAELDRLRASQACCPLRSEKLNALADEPAGKAATLLQAHISRAPFAAFTLASDAAYVAKNAARVCRALFEMALRAHWPSLAERLLALAKAVERRLWWFQHPMRQLADLEPNLNVRRQRFPEDALRQLEAHKLDSDRLLNDLNVGEVGALIRNTRAAPFLVRACRSLPAVELTCSLKPITRSVLRVSLTLTPAYEWAARVHGLGPEPWWVWVEDAAEERIHHCELALFPAPKRSGGKRGPLDPLTLCFTMAVRDPLPPQFYCRAISDRWSACSNLLELSTNDLSLPAPAPPPTELLPLRPLPVSALEDDRFQQFYAYTHFNPVQTQVFHALFRTDGNVLVGAPTGSGKTCLAELAIFRLLRRRGEEKLKAVYVAPLKALARERVRDWTPKFASMGLRVEELTGDATPDKRALQRADILITTPEKWDGVTRQFKRRDYARHAALMILDEVHLLGEDRGPVLEALVSRARFTASQRIVALSTALANAHDLGAWLGCHKTHVFNFRASVRPVAMEAHIQGFTGKHYCPRMATMNKPCYSALREHAHDKPALIFVASRRQTRLTALDLIALAAADDDTSSWVGCAVDELDALARTAKDPALRHCLPFGVGVHHGGLNKPDRDCVEGLFTRGAIKVLVCTSTLAWGVNFPARLVIVKGTEFFDGKLGRYVDFPVTDVLQMMGRAGRPQFDSVGVACIFVHQPKKEFYKKFLYEPFPVESKLLSKLNDFINAEVCLTGRIKSVDDAIEWLRWTYLHKRLRQNPSFYECADSSEKTISLYLENLARTSLEVLDEAGVVELDGDQVSSLVLGSVAAYYYLDYRTTSEASVTVEVFDIDLGDAPPRRHEALALAHLCAAREFAELPVRHNEDVENSQLAQLLLTDDDHDTLDTLLELGYDSPHAKAQLLVHAKLRDGALPVADYATDQRSVLEQAPRVLAALIDVAADAGCARACLALLELSQALRSACSVTRDPLCQLGLSDAAAQRVRASQGVSKRDGVADLKPQHIAKLPSHAARALDALPRGRAQLTATAVFGAGATPIAEIAAGGEFSVDVTLNVRGRGPRAFYLVLSDDEELIALKKVVVGGAKCEASLAVEAPNEGGSWRLVLRAVYDGARGFDARVELPALRVSAAPKDLSVKAAEFVMPGS